MQAARCSFAPLLIPPPIPPPPPLPVAQASYEGQEHTSRMVPQEGGAVLWGEAESVVIAALRPVGDAPLELALYGSRDIK